MKETLQKALDDLDFACSDLRGALNKGTATESLVILPMIKTAAELRIEVNSLLNTHLYDTKEE